MLVPSDVERFNAWSAPPDKGGPAGYSIFLFWL